MVTSSAGGVGIIMTSAARDWPFLVSNITLSLGIFSQLANHFGVAKLAADSESLAQLCRQYKIQLEDALTESDPQAPIADLFKTISRLLQRYEKVLPSTTDTMEAESKEWAIELIKKNQPHWELKLIRQRTLNRPRADDREP